MSWDCTHRCKLQASGTAARMRQRRISRRYSSLTCGGAGEGATTDNRKVGPCWAVVRTLLLCPDVGRCHPHLPAAAVAGAAVAGVVGGRRRVAHAKPRCEDQVYSAAIVVDSARRTGSNASRQQVLTSDTQSRFQPDIWPTDLQHQAATPHQPPPATPPHPAPHSCSTTRCDALCPQGRAAGATRLPTWHWWRYSSR